MNLKTIEVVGKAVAALKSKGNATMGTAVDHLKAVMGLSTREALGAWLVSCERVLPETVIVQCPAADNLMQLSIEQQFIHVVQRKPFEVLEDLDSPPVMKTYDQLTPENCEVLFPPCTVREVIQAIDAGDECYFTFKGGNYVGFTRIQRDKHKRRG